MVFRRKENWLARGWTVENVIRRIDEGAVARGAVK